MLSRLDHNRRLGGGRWTFGVVNSVYRSGIGAKRGRTVHLQPKSKPALETMGLLSARRVLIGLPNGVCKVGLGPLVDCLGALLRVERGRVEYNQPRLLAARAGLGLYRDLERPLGEEKLVLELGRALVVKDIETLRCVGAEQGGAGCGMRRIPPRSNIECDRHGTYNGERSVTPATRWVVCYVDPPI